MPSTLKKTKKSRLNTTVDKSVIVNQSFGMVHMLLELLMSIKFYHWRTSSFSQHKATDELYEELNESIDEFTEALMGATNKKIMPTVQLNVINPKDVNQLESLINDRIAKLNSFPFDKLSKSASAVTDLMNIRDEMMAALHKFLYLLKLDGPKNK